MRLAGGGVGGAQPPPTQTGGIACGGGGSTVATAADLDAAAEMIAGGAAGFTGPISIRGDLGWSAGTLGAAAGASGVRHGTELAEAALIVSTGLWAPRSKVLRPRFERVRRLLK